VSTGSGQSCRRSETPGLHEGFHHGASYVEHLLFLEAIRCGGTPEVTVQDGLLSVALGVAAHRSIDEGRAVDLAEFGL
jgi:myo-inositol 2-dehydrogenase/D-chiro-inositol 1-dehydrogenase